MSAARAGMFPPDEETLAILADVPHRRERPQVVTIMEAPTAGGPEQAGALSLVYATFSDSGRAQQGYRRFAEMQHHLITAPGFLRWITLVDGVHGYALGMWRRPQDVAAFARSGVHRRMVHDQLTDPFEHSQFAGVWTAQTPGRRTLTCERCHQPTTAPAEGCARCGAPLHDPFGTLGG